MDQILINPAFQSGILPFVVASITALLLRRFGWYWSSIGFVLGYYCSVYITTGFQLLPLTSTRKIIILGIVATVLGLLRDSFEKEKRYYIFLPPLLGSGFITWLIWPVLNRATGMDFTLMLTGAILYVAIICVAFEMLRNKSITATVGASAIGMGCGISALLGASALLGQLGIAVGTSAGALVILIAFNKDIRIGTSFTFPAAVLSSCTGVAAVIYASLPWFALLPLAVIPLAPQVVFKIHGQSKHSMPRIQSILVFGSIMFALAAASVTITWQVTGAPPF